MSDDPLSAHLMPLEHGVPYGELSHEELLEVAKRPVFDNQFQRDHFTSDVEDWDVIRAFVDARDDLTDGEWKRISLLAYYKRFKEKEPDEDLRRWVGTKSISEQAKWDMGYYDHFYEAFDHLSVDAIMERIKNGQPFFDTRVWLSATRNIGSRIREIETTDDVRTLGYAIGMSGQPLDLEQLEAVLSGDPHSPVHYTGNWGRYPDLHAEEFAVGFSRTEPGEANETTLLATLQLLRKHSHTIPSIDRTYKQLAQRPEAQSSKKIQRWLTGRKS